MRGAGKSTWWEDVPGTRGSCVQGDPSLFPLFPGMPPRAVPTLCGFADSHTNSKKCVFLPISPLCPAGSGCGRCSKEWCCGGGMKAPGQGHPQAWPHPELLNSSPRVNSAPEFWSQPHCLEHPGWASAHAKPGKGWDKLCKEDRACAITFTPPAQPQTMATLCAGPPGDPLPPPAKPEGL